MFVSGSAFEATRAKSHPERNLEMMRGFRGILAALAEGWASGGPGNGSRFSSSLGKWATPARALLVSVSLCLCQSAQACVASPSPLLHACCCRFTD